MLRTLTFQYIRMGDDLAGRGQSVFKLLASILKRRGVKGLPKLKRVYLLYCYDEEGDVVPSKRDLKKIPVAVYIDES